MLQNETDSSREEEDHEAQLPSKQQYDSEMYIDGEHEGVVITQMQRQRS